jgi:ditrans,polycis-polyprenyl diphosphate synthase
MNIHGNM